MPPSLFHNLLLLAGLCCLLPGSQTKGHQMTGNSGHDKKQKGPQCQNFALTITNISLSLLQKAIHWSGHTNIVFSPVSITAAFTMLSLGAKGNTHKQIFSGLRFNLLKMPEMEIHRCFQHLLQKCLQPNYQIQMITGSSLFIDKRLEVADKFKKVITELYHSETIPTNFRDIQEAKTQINKHTLKRSYGYISEVVEDLPIDTALALVNYLSFEGIRNDNYADHTMKAEFYLDTGEVVYLSMINRLDKFYLQKDRHLFSWVLMQHYVENSMAFFILPDPEKMQQLLQNLSPEYLNSIQRNMNQRVVNLNFPKFTVSATYDLETVMRTLGITEIFSNKADLSKVTKDAPVKVSKFKQFQNPYHSNSPGCTTEDPRWQLGWKQLSKWKYRFNPKLTEMRNFSTDKGTQVMVPMMQRVDWFQLQYFPHLHSYVLQLPCTCNVSGVFILPNEGKFEECEKALLEESFDTWI